MIDAPPIRQMLADEGLVPWSLVIEDQLDSFFGRSAHGDWERWRGVIAALPIPAPGGRVVDESGTVAIIPGVGLDAEQTQFVSDALQRLHPWRKGPFRVDRIDIDSEWRSDWKWDRIAPHLAPLDGRLVLDVGCGNGYFGWRLALAGARRVIGIDPTALFLAQFLALRKLVAAVSPGLAARVDLLPVGIEDVPAILRRFDTVLSMGVLYHRRSPIDHLFTLRDLLQPGGQLVLETLVIEGRDDAVLLPRGRYAKMRNVWFIPTARGLETWLERVGFRAVETVDVAVTSVEEQRRTAWMTFESLGDFLDPADTSLTVEGYPAPRRAVLVATA